MERDAGVTVEETDFLVLGAGAAGLIAAAYAARSGVRTLLVEKGRQTGIKILIAGGGHCNLTHDCSVREMLAGFDAAASFLEPSMKAWSPRAVRRHFERIGVPTYVGERRKVWPVSRRARDVRNALESEARAAGARIRLHTAAEGVEREPGSGFLVRTPSGPIRCRRLLITTGGQSYPRTGTTGDGYRLAGALGHGLVEPVPALVPIVVEDGWVRELPGISLPQVALRFRGKDGKERGRSAGPLLLTHTGLSGPAALDIGGRIARHGRPGVLHVDWQPGLAPETLDRTAATAATGAHRPVRHLLAPWLPERLARALVRSVARLPVDRTTSQLRVEERRALVQAVKDTRLAVTGTLGFARAEVTAGGIPLDEVDPVTLASRRVPGLFIAGEVLDYDGLLGGYNLQAAFCTGKAAGVAQGVGS
jgi:predicted Rossmann fold flavoprotein